MSRVGNQPITIPAGVDIKNKDSACSISNIYNFTKVRCDIFIDKVWKYNDKYVCKWKVSKILIH